MRNLAEICSIKESFEIVYKGETYTKVRKYTLNENAHTFISAGNFKNNDLVVFIGEGSLIPETNSDFEFLRKSSYSTKRKAFRIKPIKMCGEISMGLLMPLSVLPEGKYKIGQDVTKLLNITKYEPIEDASPIQQKKSIKSFMFRYLPFIASLIWKKSIAGGSAFPSWLISKTDEDNIEYRLDDIEKYGENGYYNSTKMEGQSGTFFINYKKFLFWNSSKLVCCSRNIAYYKYVDNNYWNVAKLYNLENVLKTYNKNHDTNIAIQGEICGDGIQGNIYKFDKLHLFIFNVKDIKTNRYYNYDEILDFIKETNLTMVPVLQEGEQLKDFVNKENLEEVRQNYVERLGFKIVGQNQIEHNFYDKIDNNKTFHDEGIVIRSKIHGLSCKFKSKEYALWFANKVSVDY